MASLAYRSKAVRFAGVFLGLVLAGLLLAPYLLSLARYRAIIVDQLEQETGRDIEIDKLRFHFLPALGVQVVNFRVRNPRGFAAGDTLVVERIEVELALGPLLRRQVEVKSVTLRRPRLNLLENQRGQTNYHTLVKRQRASGRKKSRAEEKAPGWLTGIDTVALRDASFWSGTVRRRDHRVHPGWTLSGINAEARGFKFRDPRWLRKVEAEVAMSGIEISHPGWPQPLRLADGELHIKHSTAEGEFTLALGSLRARGTLRVANLERPVADFTLAMKELNLAEVKAVMGGNGVGGDSSPSRRGDPRPRLLARGTVRVDRVHVPPLRAQNLQGEIRLYSHRLEVEPFTLDFYNGRGRGRLQVNLTRASLPTQANFSVEGVEVAQVLEAASPGAQPKLRGTFEAQGSLRIPLGRDETLAGLSGQGNFAVRDGAFPGLNLEGVLAKFLAMGVSGDTTRFRFLGGDFRIDNQRVYSGRLRLEAESLEASLQGSFGFDQTLNYAGTGVLTGTGAQPQEPARDPLSGLRSVFGEVMQQTVSGTRLPFTVRGTFQEPRFILAGTPQPIG